ncbi:transposase [Vibrio crassostreae]|uniref:DDE-type integrase/transposase/recombinase n=1 Tax=Vibrio crassostreae TaxID=246167 RepID=UPI001BD6D118|nr:DDE-type integrase/transposase/recombinase [Vibrio crassostreae]CAK1928418.1 transposase [Vibrio crassostreae]CAK1958736.1 transposase [Vibrio crassostreae]CAK2238853.1 transposase [Vibrio crassostreae]CAK2597004.1 transposase [Vibrio crassostreae]CAK2688160.1 transposase [Vibrio crassostreae]
MVGYDHPQHSSALTFSFTGRHFLSELILQSVRYYISYKLSYGEIKKPVASSWRMDETYINVKGQRSKVKGQYYSRAVDKHGHVIDFLLCERRDEKVAPAFFAKAICYDGLPEKVVIDKSGTNALALHNVNVQLGPMGKILNLIEVCQIKYLNNIVEQSHRKVKGKINQCLGWKSDKGASSTLIGMELWTIIKNEQLDNPEGLSAWEQFYALAP